MSENMSLLFQNLPSLSLTLSASEELQIRNSAQSSLGTPTKVAPLRSSSGIARAENQLFLVDSLPVTSKIQKRFVVALISDYNRLSRKDRSKSSKIFQIPSNISYLQVLYQYLTQQLRNDQDIINCFFLFLKSLSIARKSFQFNDSTFLPISSASRLINASLCLLLNLPSLSSCPKITAYAYVLRLFLKNKVLNNSAILSALLLPRSYGASNFYASATANLKTLNAEFISYASLFKQYNNTPSIKNNFIDIIYAYYTLFFSITEDADITESGISDTFEFLNNQYSRFIAEPQIGISINHTIDGSLDDAINKSLSLFSELSKALSDKYQTTVNDYQRKIIASITSIYNLYRFTTHKLSLQDFCVNLCGVIGAAGLASDIITQLIITVRSLFLMPTAQSLSAGNFNIIKSIFLSLYCIFVGTLPGKHTVDEFALRMDRFPKMISGIETMWSKLDLVVGQAHSFIEEKFLGRNNKFVSSEMLDEVTAWADDVAKYAGYMERNEINRDIETMTAASKLYPRGVRLIKECTRLKLAPANLNLIRSLLPGAIKLSDAAFKSGANKHSLRVEPIVAWFTGSTGLGKTGMTYPFIIDMMRVFGPVPADWQQNIHARIAENEYWDGYDDQEYLIYDDFLQKKDSAANPNVELFEMIRVTNAFPFQLHMSSVEDKSNKFCNAKFVFLSSNLDVIKTESLNCPEAVQRRIDYAYRVSIKPEFREYYLNASGQQCFKLDAEKARNAARILLGPNNKNLTTNNLEVYIFERFSVFDGKTLQTNMTYKDVVEQCSSALENRFARHVDSAEYLEAYRNPQWLESTPPPNYEAPLDIVEFPLQASAEIGVGSAAAVIAARASRVLIIQHFICALFFGNTKDTALMDFLYGIKHGMSRLLEKFSIIPRSSSIWDNESFSYYQNHALSVKNYLSNCKQQLSDTLVSTLGAGWKYFKIALLAGIFILTTMFVRSVERKCLPKFISEDEKLSVLVKEANTCLDNDCRNCKTCSNSVSTPLNAKWNSNCACYIRRMEISRDNIRQYCVSMYGNQRVSPDHEMTLTDMYDVIEQICNCDCSVCPYCNDEELKSKLFETAKLHKTNCVCLLTRFYQGFRTESLLQFLMTLKDNLPAYSLKNRELIRLISQHGIKDIPVLPEFSQNLTQGPLYDAKIKNVAPVTKILNQAPAIYENRQARNAVRTVIKNQAPQYDAKMKHVTTSRIVNQSVANLTPFIDDVKTIISKADIHVRDACTISNCGRCLSEQTTPSLQRNLPEQDVGAITIVRDVVYKNLFKFVVTKTDSGNVKTTTYYGQIFMLGGRLGLIPKHFLRAIKMDLELGFSLEFCLEDAFAVITSRYPVDVILDAENHIEHDSRDLAIIQLPINAGCYSQAFKHIVDEQDLFRVGHNPGILARYQAATEKDRLKGIRHYREMFYLSTLTPEDSLVETNMRDEIITNRGSYLYHAVTVPGDCGSVLVARSTSITQKIVGIHIAGLMGVVEGISVSITQQMIVKMMSHFKSSSQYGHAVVPFDVRSDILRENGTFQLHGTKVGVRINGSVKTAMTRSAAFGALCVSPNKPGHLRPFVNSQGERIDPMKLQRSKYGVVRPFITFSRVQTVYEAMAVFYHREYQNTPEWYKQPLSLEEAIIGIDGDPFINAINRQTAPGYPYTLNKPKGTVGKQGWFGKEMEYDLTNSHCLQLLDDVEQLKLSMLENVRPEVIWIDTLKDAKIPIAKADVGKTRLFTACPMHYSIAFRQYFLPFIAHAMRNRVDNSLAVGINPTSVEWTKLAQRLQRQGSNVIAGDYSNFDGTLPVQYVEVAVKIMCDWLLANWENIVKANRNVVCGRNLTKEQFHDFIYKLGMECFNHLHIANHEEAKGALVYFVRNGIPSGCPATAILNSIVNHCVLADSWLSIMQSEPLYEHLATMSAFFEHTSSIFYGDDFIMNIRHSVIDLYNQETLTQVLKTNLDMDMTDEAKTGDIVKARKLADVSFLKRKFRFEESIQLWVSPIDINVLLDAPNWVRAGNASALQICVDTLSTYCLTELALHDRDVDEHWRPKMVACGLNITRGTGITFNPDSRRSVLAKFRNEQLNTEINF